MKAMTVQGLIEEDQLGKTLPHEHVIIDLSFLYQESSTGGMPVGSLDRNTLCLNPTVSKDNLVLGDLDLAVRELAVFKEAGGSGLVDLTLPGLGRNASLLREVSRLSGLHIICSTGWNSQSTYPKFAKEARMEELTEAICSELTRGIDGTSIRAGIIGEIGMTGPITPSEDRILRAAGKAQAITGATIVIDTLPLLQVKYASEALDILEREGTNPRRVVFAHCDFDNGLNKGYVRSLLERGVNVEFDGFGTERPDYSQWLGADSRLMLPTDVERVDFVRELTENGYARRILLSHDTCMKYEYATYGGAGYGHILRNIVPALRKVGVNEGEIDSMIIDNPPSTLAYLT